MTNPTYHERNLTNLNKLAPNTKEAALKWYDYCVKNGVNVLIYETIRTVERQKQLVADKKSQTMKSYHIVGQALDFVPIVNDKEGWNSYKSDPFKTAIKYAKSIGFEWGGDWKGFVDQPHLQFNYKGYGTDKVLEVKPKPIIKPKTPIFPGKVIKKGDKGENIKLIQRALKINSDGIYGNNTEKAIKNFQKKNKLTIDGIIGKNTWSKLFN